MATGRKQKNKNTEAELRLRRELRRNGVSGYRLNYRVSLPVWGGRKQWTVPDITFLRQKVAVYVHGCHWHCCPSCYEEPVVNVADWRQKGADARARDERHMRALTVQGWRVFVLWEHESYKDGAHAVETMLNTDTPPGCYTLP